ncbi:MAG: serine hydrolase, partial [Bacteroidota bacterium]
KSYTGLAKWDAYAQRRDFTPLEMIDYFKEEPMDFASGEEFRYNNSGYFILGYVIEKASGMTYEAYVEQELFAPLGMRQSYYGNPEEIIAKRVAGYMPSADGGLKNAEYLSMTQPYAAGSLLSTVGDLAKWYAAVQAGKVVKPASLELALAPTTLNNGTTEDYGFGLGLVDIKGSKGYGHGGGIHGFLTASTYLPGEDVFVAVFSNSNLNAPDGPATRLAEIAIGKYAPPKMVKVGVEVLKRCAGVYQLGPGFNVTVKVEDNHLVGQATGQGPLKLMPTAQDTYLNEGSGIKIQFDLKADSGAAPSFTLFQGGREMVAKRLEQ